jgi:hypothetical protein
MLAAGGFQGAATDLKFFSGFHQWKVKILCYLPWLYFRGPLSLISHNCIVTSAKALSKKLEYK